MRDLQSKMLAAVLDGAGLEGVAELAATEAGGPVAIVLPARGLAAAAPVDQAPAEVLDHVASALRGNGVAAPAAVEAELAVSAGDERIGSVVAMSANGSGPPSPLKVDLDEVLRAAAFAALAQVAATDARDRLADEVRGGVLEDLRTGATQPEETVRRAARLGCDLTHGAVVLAAEIRSGKPRFAAALITSEWDGALAEPLDGDLLLALLPGREGEGEAERALERARRTAGRLRSHGPAAFSSYCAEPGELDRAVREAELALEVIARDERLADQLQDGIGGGVYRLLFRALASSPEEVRSFYADTVEPLVEHDRQYRTDLLGTLEAYLANDCNTNATARAVYAHRHTVAHRLDRVRELSGLDPSIGEDRERLGLGVKAYRILAPTLPR
jgi:sugar diacid utilization regulator